MSYCRSSIWISITTPLKRSEVKPTNSTFLPTQNKFNLLPVPSASSKIIFTVLKFFWASSIFFEHSQIFWSWSKARFYLINLHIWAWSKIFEHIQKILNTVKNIWTSRWIRHKLCSSNTYTQNKTNNLKNYQKKTLLNNSNVHKRYDD